METNTYVGHMLFSILAFASMLSQADRKGSALLYTSIANVCNILLSIFCYRFKVQFYGFADVCQSFLHGFAFTDATRQRRNVDGVTTFFALLQNYFKLHSCPPLSAR